MEPAVCGFRAAGGGRRLTVVSAGQFMLSLCKVFIMTMTETRSSDEDGEGTRSCLARPLQNAL